MSEWISVKDRLPEVGEHVLVFSPITGIKNDFIAFVENDEEDRFFLSGRVTHWVPLPKPPELSEHETTTFKPIATDARGYACQFSCNACDCVVSRAHYMRPDQFDYNYCPYCGRPVESEGDAE